MLTREQAPIGDSEASTIQTVQRMAEHIRNSAGDSALTWAAQQALHLAGGPESSVSARCCAVFNWCKARIRFRTDDDLIAEFFHQQNELELLISPPVLLRSRRPTGDCDDFTMLACALLHELGVETEIVTVKADQPDPRRWSHVYCSAKTEKGPMVLDTSHGDYPGWEVPHYYAKRFWDSRSGQPLRSEGARIPQPRRRGLHGYARGRRGMGDTITDPMTGITADVSGPSIGTAFIDSLPNIINQGFKTLQLAVMPTGGYLVQGPNGQYQIANQAGALPSLNLGTSGIGMGTVLLIGGAVVLLMLVKK